MKKEDKEVETLDFCKQQVVDKIIEISVLSFMPTVISIATGNRHILILTKELKVYSMGLGIGGVLGHGDEITRDKSPKLIEILANSKTIKIFASGDQSAALTEQRQLLW